MRKLLLGLLIVVTAIFMAGCGSSKLAEVTGMNDMQEKATIKIFNDNGIKDLSNVEKSSQGNNIFLFKSDKFGMVLFALNQDKSIKNIVYETVPIYAEGKSLNKFVDMAVSNIERAEYEVAAQSAVKNKLKSPSTANFQSFPVIMRNKDIVLVKGKLDAQNGFGAMIRSDYIVKLQLPNKTILEVNI